MQLCEIELPREKIIIFTSTQEVSCMRLGGIGNHSPSIVSLTLCWLELLVVGHRRCLHFAELIIILSVIDCAGADVLAYPSPKL